MFFSRIRGTLVGAALVIFGVSNVNAQQPVDPGVRGGVNGGGPAIAGLAPQAKALWKAGQGFFEDTFSATGTDANTLPGLGPVFNGNSCAMCHSQGGIGGTSQLVNQQLALTNIDGAQNTAPPFLNTNSPSLEARFKLNADGTPDNGVHQLFTIKGQPAAGNCKYLQPDFATAIANNNIALRIPTPTFGLGFVENTTDYTLEYDAAHIAGHDSLGIVSGVFNRSANTGAITRFGWKAQNPSLLLFTGEAFNVEMGVTNGVFPTIKNPDLKKFCDLNSSPEDPQPILALTQVDPSAPSPTADFLTIVANVAAFIQLNAAPAALPITTNDLNLGKNAFINAGCGICHIPTHTTGVSSLDAMLTNVTYSPYSDFAIHNMGPGLADGITQGLAGPDQFRTAPLWGVGQRIFFLHDGRTTDIVQAILAHQSPASQTIRASEANGVIANFNNLTPADKQSLIDFLRSL